MSEPDAHFRELMQIFGNDPPELNGKEFVHLPLVNGTEARDCLRSVPAGTSLRDLAALAVDYRATHPVPRDDKR
jgi:hypothetical protein